MRKAEKWNEISTKERKNNRIWLYVLKCWKWRKINENGWMKDEKRSRFWEGFPGYVRIRMFKMYCQKYFRLCLFAGSEGLLATQQRDWHKWNVGIGGKMKGGEGEYTESCCVLLFLVPHPFPSFWFFFRSADGAASAATDVYYKSQLM